MYARRASSRDFSAGLVQVGPSHLGLTQILGHLNGYNRSTQADRRAGVNLCLFPGVAHITINEGRVQEED